MSDKQHWETVYNTKQPHEVSWTQVIPETSLRFIRELSGSKSDAIIDVGGGDSLLVDFLLEDGFTDLTVLDISEQALERAKRRLGEKAALVKWIVADVSKFLPERNYKIWHDRAAFHFLTTEEERINYLNIISYNAKRLVIGAFSERGPLKCSGLEIRQYSEESMADFFAGNFRKLKCVNEDHVTPFNTIQNFTFCSFERKD